MESNQYFPLTAFSPSLALISSQLSAGSSGIVPRETKNRVCSEDLLLVETNNQRNNLTWLSGALTPVGSCKPGKYLNFYYLQLFLYRNGLQRTCLHGKVPLLFSFSYTCYWLNDSKKLTCFLQTVFFFQKRHQHVLKCIQNQKVRPVLLTCSSVWSVKSSQYLTRLANNLHPFFIYVETWDIYR